MKTTIYRVFTRSDDGDISIGGRKYYATNNLHSKEEAEAKCAEWSKDSPSYIQESTNGGKTWN